MTLTFPELKERLKQLDEVDILEILDITTEDILNHFEDKIEGKFDELIEEFDHED